MTDSCCRRSSFQMETSATGGVTLLVRTHQDEGQRLPLPPSLPLLHPIGNWIPPPSIPTLASYEFCHTCSFLTGRPSSRYDIIGKPDRCHIDLTNLSRWVRNSRLLRVGSSHFFQVFVVTLPSSKTTSHSIFAS